MQQRQGPVGPVALAAPASPPLSCKGGIRPFICNPRDSNKTGEMLVGHASLDCRVWRARRAVPGARCPPVAPILGLMILLKTMIEMAAAAAPTSHPHGKLGDRGGTGETGGLRPEATNAGPTVPSTTCTGGSHQPGHTQGLAHTAHRHSRQQAPGRCLRQRCGGVQQRWVARAKATGQLHTQQGPKCRHMATPTGIHNITDRCRKLYLAGQH